MRAWTIWIVAAVSVATASGCTCGSRDKRAEPAVRPSKDKPPAVYEKPMSQEEAVAHQLDMARAALKEGRYEEALAMCEEIIGVQPHDLDAIAVCAVAACHRGELGKAREYAGIVEGERSAEVARGCAAAGVNLEETAAR
jgi:Tfp pilus assembly protein PilF